MYLTTTILGKKFDVKINLFSYNYVGEIIYSNDEGFSEIYTWSLLGETLKERMEEIEEEIKKELK